MNKFIGTGRLAKDVELRFAQGTGNAIANFTVACDSGYGDKKETAFLNVVVFGKAAENVANYTQKGSKVLVQGKISTRSYDGKDGKKHYVTEIIADSYGGVEFLDNKKSVDIPMDLTPEGDGISF